VETNKLLEIQVSKLRNHSNLLLDHMHDLNRFSVLETTFSKFHYYILLFNLISNECETIGH
jgi:hypothetical protein